MPIAQDSWRLPEETDRINSRGVFGLPEVLKSATTCAPEIYTTTVVETATLESVVTVPHSCFRFTVAAPQITGKAFSFFSLSSCYLDHHPMVQSG